MTMRTKQQDLQYIDHIKSQIEKRLKIVAVTEGYNGIDWNNPQTIKEEYESLEHLEKLPGEKGKWLHTIEQVKNSIEQESDPGLKQELNNSISKINAVVDNLTSEINQKTAERDQDPMKIPEGWFNSITREFTSLNKDKLVAEFPYFWYPQL